jgi:hypothetical protein
MSDENTFRIGEDAGYLGVGALSALGRRGELSRGHLAVQWIQEMQACTDQVLLTAIVVLSDVGEGTAYSDAARAELTARQSAREVGAIRLKLAPATVRRWRRNAKLVGRLHCAGDISTERARATFEGWRVHASQGACEQLMRRVGADWLD